MSDLKIGRIVLSVCATNCYFVYHEGKNECIVFDPADRGDYIYNALTEKGFKVKAILLTHGHFDHIWGCSKLRALTSAPVYALDEEKDLLESSRLNCSEMAGRGCSVKANTFVHDLDVLEIEGFKIQVLATPGHTKGSACYYFIDDETLISGDTLFEESIGRTDLATGSMSALVHSIEEKLEPLGDEVKVYPGHGNQTTIGHEKKYNPFWRR